MFFFISSHFMKSNVLTKKEQLQIRGVHDCMLITILIVIFQNLLSLMFFRHVWSHNLDFVKLTEISWRVHCYMLIKCFFRNSFHLYFFGNLGPKIWSSSNWLKSGTEVDCYMLISILLFVFSKFLLLIFFGKTWSNWNLVEGYISMCLLRF